MPRKDRKWYVLLRRSTGHYVGVMNANGGWDWHTNVDHAVRLVGMQRAMLRRHVAGKDLDIVSLEYGDDGWRLPAVN